MNIMKIYIATKYMLATFILAFVLTGCEEELKNPTFTDDEIPKIFGWETNYGTDIEDPIEISVQVSPSDNVTYRWSLDGEEISTHASFEYLFDDPRAYEIHLEVERNGVTNTRTGVVEVNKPFVPKDYAKKMVGFLTKAGSFSDISFDHLTHLVISSAVVAEVEGQESLVDTTFADLNIPMIVQSAHNAGVYVMLDVTGDLVPINGGGYYADYKFFNVIADPDKRATVIETSIKFASDNNMDGINIYLNNTSEGYLNPDVVTAFFNEIPASLPSGPGPDGEFFYSASVPGGWTTGVLSPLADVERIDWVNVQPYRYENLEPVSHSPGWAFGALGDQWIGFGMPAEKIVGGIPAFGLKYDMPTDGTTVGWGNLWMFTLYMTYREILAIDSEAYTKNLLAVDDGIFYDGHADIQAKAATVIDKGYGGMMMWSIESDTKNEDQSLLKAAYEALGN